MIKSIINWDLWQRMIPARKIDTEYSKKVKSMEKKFDRKTQGKINTIVSEIEGFMLEFPPQHETDKESMLGYFANILCQFDTDVAIKVMEDLGKAGKYHAMAIKVNQGY